MSNKALSTTELEVTQKIQTHFPRGLSTRVLSYASSCPVEQLSAAIRGALEGLAHGAKTVVHKILEYVTVVEVTEVKKFVAQEMFKEGATVDGVTYYSEFGGNFKKHFLPKIETDVHAATLRVHKLTRNSRDLGIRTEIGEEFEETSLAHLHQCLKRQGNGEKGVLLTNGCANIFYIRDTEGNLWAVRAYWDGHSWALSASSVGHPRAWDAGRRVFSR